MRERSEYNAHQFLAQEHVQSMLPRQHVPVRTHYIPKRSNWIADAALCVFLAACAGLMLAW